MKIRVAMIITCFARQSSFAESADERGIVETGDRAAVERSSNENFSCALLEVYMRGEAGHLANDILTRRLPPLAINRSQRPMTFHPKRRHPDAGFATQVHLAGDRLIVDFDAYEKDCRTPIGMSTGETWRRVAMLLNASLGTTTAALDGSTALVNVGTGYSIHPALFRRSAAARFGFGGVRRRDQLPG